MAGVFVVSSLVLGLRLGHSGSDNHISFACHRQDRRGGGESTSGGYLGPVSTVAGGERRGVAGALRSDQDMLLILTDSIAAKATTINLARGAPPRSSSIECDIKAALQRREAQQLDTGISWVRAHICIRGNELADQHALFQSYRGAIAGDKRTATEGGIRRIAKKARAVEREVEGYGLGGRNQ